jgi:hypothetical protein
MNENNENTECCPKDTKGLSWRVSLSIAAGVGWLVFLIIWLFFYAMNYSWEKNLAIIMLSIIVVGLILGGPWSIWWFRHQSKKEKEMWNTHGFRWRVWLSGIVFIGVFVFLIYWFWYKAEELSLYQNIAIFIVTFLIFGGIMGALWAAWGMKHEHDWEKPK